MRETVPSPLLATQTAPPPIASAVGFVPTGIAAVTELASGSIRRTVLSPLSATQTAPGPTTIALGLLPTGIVVVAPVWSTRVTLPDPPFATQTAPAPTAIALGPLPTSAEATTLSRAGSTRDTVPSRFATQIASVVTARATVGTRCPNIRRRTAILPAS